MKSKLVHFLNNETILKAKVSQVILLAFAVFVSIIVIQRAQLRNPFVGDEILYIYNTSCTNDCPPLNSFFELHLPLIKIVNTIVFHFTNSFLALRLIGFFWFSLLTTSLFFLIRRFFPAISSALITTTVVSLPIPVAYASSFESITPGIFFLILMIHALQDSDERKLNLYFILGSLTHISTFIYGLVLIGASKRYEKNLRPSLIFSIIYILYILFLMTAKPIFGIDISSMRLSRHFHPPRDMDTFWQRVYNTFYISKLYLPIFFAAVVIGYSRVKSLPSKKLVTYAALLFTSFFVLQINYDSNATKNALYANILLLPAFLSLFRVESQRQQTILVALTCLCTYFSLPPIYQVGRYQISNLNMLLGYNHSISRIIEAYSNKCQTQVSSNLSLLTKKFYGYKEVNVVTNDHLEEGTQIFIKYHEGIGVTELKNIPTQYRYGDMEFNYRKIYHNLSEEASAPIKKLAGLEPALNNKLAFDRQAMALVVYARRPECLEL